MPDTTNDIDALLDYLGMISIPESRRYHAALTALLNERNELRDVLYTQIQGRDALIAERDALREENNALASRCKVQQDEVLDRVFEMDAMRRRIAELEAAFKPADHAALIALLAERNSLKQRVAELEAHPPADRDLRERLLESALRGVSLSGYDKRGSESLGRAAVWMVDAAIAAMRKGDTNAK